VGGRRLTDKYIQRTLPADSKGDCELYCEYEKEFRCEGFNFRFVLLLFRYTIFFKNNSYKPGYHFFKTIVVILNMH